MFKAFASIGQLPPTYKGFQVFSIGLQRNLSKKNADM